MLAGVVSRRIVQRHLHVTSPKVVTISPGGFRGFYMMGVASYIRDHFNTDACFFSGASVGAWISLLMTYRGNHTALIHELNVLTPHFTNLSLAEMQTTVADRILGRFKTADFDLKRLFVGVSRIKAFGFENDVYSDFRDLRDAVECCQASSHIPMITGGFLRKYDRQWTFDGGFCANPYLMYSDPALHIGPEIWVSDPRPKPCIRTHSFFKNIQLVLDQTSLFSRHKFDLEQMYLLGYRDSAANHSSLASVFSPRRR